MNRKKNVALLFGGFSEEAEVSQRSAEQVRRWIDEARYNVCSIRVSPDGAWMRRNELAEADVALVMIHGAPGENGVLQAYLDLLQIPYTTCDAFVSALTFNKYACKCYVEGAGSEVQLAKSVLVRRGDAVRPDELVKQLGLPLFVKPNNGGSSFGITKVKSAEALQSALDKALSNDREALAEEFIEGTEVTCGAMILNGVATVLPVSEVVSKNEFFDYEAKYNGASDEITPARIGATLTDAVQRTTMRLYRHFGCNGIVRVDYILRRDELYFLEINTVPGMTAASFIPQQLCAAGLSAETTIANLIEDAYSRTPKNRTK